MNDSFEILITSYIQNKVGISNHFLSDLLCQQLAKNIIALKKNQQLKEAGIGNDQKLQLNAKIRKDSIYWLDKKHNDPYENIFFEQMDAFILYLNQSCYAGITDYEFHYSLYESGDFYKKHLDQFKDNSSRQFSIICYLNPNWEPKDGGELYIHQKNNNQSIAPTQGKTVFFKSNELEHEVLITHEKRMSITGWLKKG